MDSKEERGNSKKAKRLPKGAGPECSEEAKITKYSQAIAKMRGSGLIVNDLTRKGERILCIGDVRVSGSENASGG
jgi:hypothetical protein